MNTSSTINVRTLLKVGFWANVFEIYEFSIYLFLAPTIGKLFLQVAEEQSLYIKTYLLFAISFLARPLGGILWGYLADRLGRGYSLKRSLFMMSIPTALIGMLPTYEQIGVWATLSFLMLRFLQGFSMGGEQAISGCYIYEASPKEQRALLCSIVGASGIIGMLAGSSVAFLLFRFFDQDTLSRWAWRLPYLFGVFITLWIAQVRRSIQEPQPMHTDAPVFLRNHLTQEEIFSFIKSLVPLVLAGGFMQICSYTLFGWLPSYLNHFLGVDQAMAQFCNIIGSILWAGFIIFTGYLSSIFGYRRIIFVHTIAMMLLILPLFKLLQTGTYSALLSAYVLFAWLHSGLCAVMMEVLGDAFPKNLRGLGMSVAQNLSVTLFGGTVGLINSLCIRHTGLLIFPAIYIVIAGLVILPIVPYLRPLKLYQQ